jgi:hypothetical protein
MSKCVYCHSEIAPNDLVQVPKRNRQGVIYLRPDGQPICAPYHKRCYEFVSQEHKEKDALYQYIQDKYFYKMIPHEMYTSMSDLRNGNTYANKTRRYAGYSYDTILACLKSLEPYLSKRMSQIQFKNDVAKCRYIMKAIQGNIDSFSKQYEQDKLKQSVQTPDTNIEFVDNTNYVQNVQDNIDYEHMFD